MGSLRGLFGCLFIALNTVFWSTLTFVAAIVKLLLPLAGLRARWAGLMNGIIDGWVSCNTFMLALTGAVRIDIRGSEGLSRGQWYLVVSNHQCWSDILVLQSSLRHCTPPLKFFTKQQLVWLPFLGQAMWALDFPFMRRYSREQLERNPELRGVDLQTTREKCERFRPTPTAILNFVEGTRNTPAKHAAQGSSHRHLLKPRAGGVGFVLGAMGDQLHRLVDVTLVYPDGVPNFFEFFSGRHRHVIVEVRDLELSRDLVGGDYVQDPAYQSRVQDWIAELWAHKDARIEALLEERGD